MLLGSSDEYDGSHMVLQSRKLTNAESREPNVLSVNGRHGIDGRATDRQFATHLQTSMRSAIFQGIRVYVRQFRDRRNPLIFQP